MPATQDQIDLHQALGTSPTCKVVAAIVDTVEDGDAWQDDPPASPESYQVFGGDIFTVQLLKLQGSSAQVRFCATAPYEGGAIPVSRERWSMRDANGIAYPAILGGGSVAARPTRLRPALL